MASKRRASIAPRTARRDTPVELSPPLAPPSGRENVEIRIGSDAWSLRSPSVDLAVRWAYVVRNRRRWSRQYHVMAERCRQVLKDLRATRSFLNAIARGGRVLVELP